ncbi:hypothetical protein O181_093125 [Austropuccinia psidii MF-1]|uniref:Uncharacterized protein n=1 Tax=Austropuccinia psidii MF-1 TaxID=1389203 RepID=A0A9Q3IZS5_9BASI|nr:hypothetical protein [Austropuccinia psidii MF-1]
MVHTRNGSNYSVQPDGCGQRRGKTKSGSGKYSSTKTHLENARVAPHSPRSAPTKPDVNSESELIHDNMSRAEPLSGGDNRYLSIPIPELVQRSQRGGVGNMPKTLAGGLELRLPHQELSGSGEEHRTLGRKVPIVLQRQGQKDKQLIEKSKSFIHRPEEATGNDSRFGERRPSGVYQLQTSSRSVQRQAPRTSEKQRGPKNHLGKGKCKGNLHRPYQQGYRISKLEPSAMDSVFDTARTLMEFTAKQQERMNRTFPCK